MRTITVKNQDFKWEWLMERFPDEAWHRHSYFLEGEKLKDLELVDYSVPEGCGLRIFKSDTWQGTSFLDSAKIQNIFWINGLAPRVREVIQFSAPNKHYKFAHVVEYVSESEIKDGFSLKGKDLEEVAKNNFITVYQGNYNEVYYNSSNWRRGQYLDFGGFSIHWNEYKEKLIKEIVDITHFGKSYNGGKASYQSISSWDLDGKRKTEYRIEKMALKDINFTDKLVLDVGCNLGLMLHYALSKGAKELAGYDLPDIVKVAKEFANFEGVFGLNFYGQDLTKEPPKERADIVFYLAVSDYLGFPQWLSDLTKELCIYEGHADDNYQETEEKLKRLFRDVRYLGNSEDRSVRPLFYCYK